MQESRSRSRSQSRNPRNRSNSRTRGYPRAYAFFLQKSSNNEEGCRVIGAMDGDSFELQLYQRHQQWAYTKGEPTILAQDTGR